MTDADCLPGKQKFCHSEAVLKQFHFCTPFLMHSEPDFHLCVCHRRADVMGRSLQVNEFLQFVVPPLGGDRQFVVPPLGGDRGDYVETSMSNGPIRMISPS